jgi:hypothetical protein
MKLIRIVKRLILALVGCWIAGCFLSFISGFVLTGLPIPWKLPLPWSDLGDFIETPDGRVFVELRFYNRVLCYDRTGQFLTAYRLPRGAKATELAVGQNNLIYFRDTNTVYTYSSTWELLSKVEAEVGAERTWELSSVTSKPVHSPQRRGEPPNRPLAPGELLFAPGERHRVYHCSDGTTLRRGWNSLQRISPAGEVLAVYQSPWPLWPFEFPFPAGFAWVAFFVLIPLLAFTVRRRLRESLQSSCSESSTP